MNTTLSPPVPTQDQPNQLRAPDVPARQRGAVEPGQHSSLFAVGMLLLALSIAHFAFIPGFVIAGQRFGWNGKLWLPLTLDPLITWPIASILIALTILYFVGSALRPLGLPVGPPNTMPAMFEMHAPTIVTRSFTLSA